MVEKANSGHPGLPLGAAPMAWALWSRHLRFNPQNPEWPGRDRFVLSAGHGSALLYSLLHITGYDLPMEELENFRQLESLTPGHPEFGLTPGVEATTGPLGQGLAMAVGMALAQKNLQARYAVGDLNPVDYRVYALVSDGDLMEGVAFEAASVAGHLGLGRLICLYDDNSISLDGETRMAFTEDVPARMAALGWQVLTVEDGNDLDAIDRAIAEAKADESKPTLISVKTQIGFGSPKANSSKAHGAPLGADDVVATRTALAWEYEAFTVPEEVETAREEILQRGDKTENAWGDLWERYEAENPEKAAELIHVFAGTLPDDWEDGINWDDLAKPMATRDAGKIVLNGLAAKLPHLIGGGADLASSTKTVIDGSPAMLPESPEGRNIWFGVREHGMGGMVNGIALSGMIGFGSTFLVFSDYMRGSLRLSALMGTHSLWIFTHDSVCVGEDGPTHEPIEHVSTLRLIPEMTVYRPADGHETGVAYKLAIERNEACCLILTRQKLPVLSQMADGASYEGAEDGAYVVWDAGDAQVILLASGSEVSLALDSALQLKEQGVRCRVVSMLSMELFDELDPEDQDAILTPGVPTLAIEAGSPDLWLRYSDSVIGLDRFGESAPGEVVYEHLGFVAENVIDQTKALLENTQ